VAFRTDISASHQLELVLSVGHSACGFSSSCLFLPAADQYAKAEISKQQISSSAAKEWSQGESKKYQIQNSNYFLILFILMLLMNYIQVYQTRGIISW